MFEDTEELFSQIKTNIDELLKNASEYEDTSGVDTEIISILSEALVSAGEKAVNKIPEYQYQPLKDQFLKNLTKPEHVVIEGNKVKIFDEEAGGSFAQLIAGQEEGGGHTGTIQAPAVWKYGIYLPYAGSASNNRSSKGIVKKLDLPTYEEVIDARLAYWESEDVAPYWYFIENGNMGNGRAFPTFTGTGFIEEIRGRASDIVRRAKELYLKHVFYDLSEATEMAVNVNPASRTRVTFYRYKSGSTNISIQKASSGNIFYRIGNKTYTVDEFRSVIGSLE